MKRPAQDQAMPPKSEKRPAQDQAMPPTSEKRKISGKSPESPVPETRKGALRKLRRLLSNPSTPAPASPASPTAPGAVDAGDALQHCAEKMITKLPVEVREALCNALTKRKVLKVASGCTGTDVWSECVEVLGRLLNEMYATDIQAKTLFTCDKDRSKAYVFENCNQYSD